MKTNQQVADAFVVGKDRADSAIMHVRGFDCSIVTHWYVVKVGEKAIPPRAGGKYLHIDTAHRRAVSLAKRHTDRVVSVECWDGFGLADRWIVNPDGTPNWEER